MKAFYLIATILILTTHLRAGDETPLFRDLPASAPLNYNPAEITGFGAFPASAHARELLLTNGFVITGETKRQISSFYIDNPGCLYITTDALLYAYFAQLEKPLMALEMNQARELTRLLDDLRAELARREPILAALPDGERWTEAAKHLDSYLLLAHVVANGRQGETLTPALDTEIDRILAASGVAKSPLRRVPLDYYRFEPKAYYTKTLELRRYYRALTWLHDVPFRVNDEDESRQALILAGLDLALDPDTSRIGRFNQPYDEYLGPSDDPGLGVYRNIFATHVGAFEKLADKNRWLAAWEAMKALPAPREANVPTFAAVRDPSIYKGLHFSPRAILYDNDVFLPLTPYMLERPPVSGEELMAAMGCPAAIDVVKDREATAIEGYEGLFKIAAAAAAAGEEADKDSIAAKKRAVYRSLFAPDDDARLPAYYRGLAWRYKDLNTCLAGWAHDRYYNQPHEKPHEMYGLLCGLPDKIPPAVVEPNMRFFAALSSLANATDTYFKKNGVGEGSFEGLGYLAGELKVIAEKQIEGIELSGSDASTLEGFGLRLAGNSGLLNTPETTDADFPDSPFVVSVCTDARWGGERLVGQARPHAIYVICESGGKNFLAYGGALAYRDMICGRTAAAGYTGGGWRSLAATDSLNPPAWLSGIVSLGPDDKAGPKGSWGKKRLLPGSVIPKVAVTGSGPSEVSGPGASLRSADVIGKYVRSHLAGIQNGYNTALKKHPQLDGGKIVAAFTIAATGEVTAASVTKSTMDCPDLERAVIARIHGWKFPPIEGGDTYVVYPFIFVKQGE